MKKILLLISALFACYNSPAQQGKKVSAQQATNVSVKTEALPAKGGSATTQEAPLQEASYTLSASPSLDPNITPAVIPVIPKAEPPKKTAQPSGSSPKK